MTSDFAGPVGLTQIATSWASSPPDRRGVVSRSARALGLPFTGYATDGARAPDVVGAQIPAFLSRAAAPDGPYELGCLYVGVNDVRGFDWDAAAYDVDVRRALAFLAGRCERVVTL